MGLYEQYNDVVAKSIQSYADVLREPPAEWVGAREVTAMSKVIPTIERTVEHPDIQRVFDDKEAMDFIFTVSSLTMAKYADMLKLRENDVLAIAVMVGTAMRLGTEYYMENVI